MNVGDVSTARRVRASGTAPVMAFHTGSLDIVEDLGEAPTRRFAALVAPICLSARAGVLVIERSPVPRDQHVAVDLTVAPVASSLIISAEGAGMAERIVEIEGKRIRVGTMADAGRLCKTSRVDGVSARTYEFYTSPRSKLADPAPGPVTVPDPTDPTNPDLVPLRDPATGALLVDLDAVVAWNARRPGPGGRSSAAVPETTQTLRRTELTERILVAARDRRLVVVRATRWGWQTFIGDEQLPGNRAGQLRSKCERLALITAPDPAGPTRQHPILLPAGVDVLTRWEVPTSDT